MNNYHDNYYLQECRKLIEQKLGWQPAEEWRNYEFVELSDKILDTTGVNLSATTLKRLFGKVKYESLPSSATLNALAAYVGYESWMDFKSKQVKETADAAIVENILEEKRSTRHINRKAIMAVAGLVLVVAFGFIFLSGRSSPTVPSPEKIVFKSRPLAEGLPNSVVFNVDLKGNRSNNIVIQQSWDSTKTVQLQPGQTEATGIYYIPGYFRAKLIVDKKIVKEHDLFIRSDHWMATIDHDPVPTYIKKEELILNNGMTISSPVLEKIKKIDKPITLTYHLVRPFEGLHSDNFTLETGFQNIYGEGPAVCKTIKLFILCTNGAFIIPVSIPGCAGTINLKLNDKLLEGRSNDLSSFCTDPAAPIGLRVEVKNRLVRILLNGKLIREEKYEVDAGDIVGLRYSFLGAGSVNYSRMYNEKGILLYGDEFKN